MIFFSPDCSIILFSFSFSFSFIFILPTIVHICPFRRRWRWRQQRWCCQKVFIYTFGFSQYYDVISTFSTRECVRASVVYFSMKMLHIHSLLHTWILWPAGYWGLYGCVSVCMRVSVSSHNHAHTSYTLIHANIHRFMYDIWTGWKGQGDRKSVSSKSPKLTTIRVCLCVFGYYYFSTECVQTSRSLITFANTIFMSLHARNKQK